MRQRAVLWSAILLAGALFAASAPWSYTLPPCTDIPAAQRERARVAGRCEGLAPIVTVPGKALGRPAASPRRPVPDLRGRVFNNNDERLARFVVAIDYRESAQRRDWVLDQIPRPPAWLPEGGSLRVVLSDGALVRVPDVRGSFARALVLLHRAGLSWSTGQGTAGPVVGQVPAAGAAVRPGTPIALRLAPGPVALAPESTRPEVAPGARPPAPPPATVPAPPPAGTTPPQPAPRTPPATAPAERTPPATITMPDVQGMLFDAARERLPGLNVQRVHRGGTEPAGTVIGQTPAAGATVAPGTTVRLVLSDGALLRVPRVTSFTLNEARQRLASGGLRPVITNVPSDAPAGTVVGQQPAEGQFAERGSTIRLNVSSGPAAAATFAVPNVVGSLHERARPQLERFRVERTERAAREPVGTILEQVPAPGTRVEAGSTVSITVSSGGRPETIDVANVVGQDAASGAGALSEFRVEREAVASVEPAGRVLSQDPPAGSSAAPGSTVRLRVSDGSRVRTPPLADRTLGEARDAARAAGLTVSVNDGTDDPRAAVLGQAPAAGTEVARGTAVQLTVRARGPFGFELPPAVGEAWTRASAAASQLSARAVAIAVVVVLALLALLLLARRRARASYVVVEPRLEPLKPLDSRVPARVRRAPVAPAPSPAATAAPSPAEPPAPVAPVQDAPSARAAAPPPVATIQHEPSVPAAAPAPVAPTPTGPSVRATAPAPVAPTQDEPSTPMFTPVAPPLAKFFARRRPPVPVVAPALEPEPAVGASARLESDPALTVAPTAAPRGPEIRIAARLDAGEGGVRELPPEPAPDALTEETK